jgi:hypothetical protein
MLFLVKHTDISPLLITVHIKGGPVPKNLCSNRFYKGLRDITEKASTNNVFKKPHNPWKSINSSEKVFKLIEFFIKAPQHI